MTVHVRWFVRMFSVQVVLPAAGLSKAGEIGAVYVEVVTHAGASYAKSP